MPRRESAPAHSSAASGSPIRPSNAFASEGSFVLRRIRRPAGALRLTATVLIWIGLGLAPAFAASPPVSAGAAASESMPAASDAEAAIPAESLLEQSWFDSGPGFARRGARTRDTALALGVENFESAARAMLATAGDGGELSHAMVAVRLAPDLPMAHMALARAYWADGDWVAAINAAAAGLWAIPKHPEASVWLVGSLLVIFAAVLVFGAIVFIGVVGASKASAAMHDMGDLFSNRMPDFSRAALLASLLLAPIAFGEGLMGLLLVLLAIGAAYGSERHRVALLSAAALLVLGLEVVFGLAGTVLTSFRADPVADAALSVTRANETPLEIERLEANSDERFAALALASRSRRFGQTEITRERYVELLDDDPRDAVLLTNMGNLLYADGDHAAAIDFYERASALSPSPTLWFNLSQAYARAFRMEELEAALHRGQAIDAERVEELSSRGDTDFVADVPVPTRDLRERMIQSADDGALASEIVDVIAPGWLGRGWMHLAGALGAALALGMLLGGRWEHSSSCSRCGTRICTRCDDQIWNADICDGCYHLFHRPQGTDPKMRTARINALRARESRLEKLWLAISVLVPGVAGLRAKRPDLAFIGILLFGWAAAIWIWHDGVVPDPLALGGIGPMAFLLSGLVAGFSYLLVLLSGLIIQRNQ